jgi:hypothetical protein
LSGNPGLTGAITFLLHDPSGTIVDTETATVNGPGIYSTPSGYLPTQAGTYQWSASYGGDANNNPAATPLGPTPTNTLTGVSDIYGVVIDAAGNRYVAESGPSDVAVFAPGSTTPTSYLTGVTNPTYFAVDMAGDLFVAGSFTSGLWEFAPGSTTPTATLSGVNLPQDLIFDASGNLFVSNAGDNTVSKYAPGSTTPTATLTGLNQPGWIAIDSSGDLFVANYGNDTVSEFVPGATTPTATLTGVSGPYGMAFDAAGNLFVGNQSTDTVSEFAPGSTTPTATFTGVGIPASVAVDSSGDVFVANFNSDTVSEFAPGSTTPTATLTAGSGPYRMAFDGQGDLYVTDYFASTVSEFMPARDPEVVQLPIPKVLLSSAGGSYNGPAGGIAALVLSATDPLQSDIAAGFTFTINWGDGTAAQKISPTANNGSGSTVPHTFAADGSYLVSVTAANLNGGVSSAATSVIVVSSHAGDNIALSGGSLPLFSAATDFASGGTGMPSMVTGDFNHDGKQDIAVVNRSAGTVGVLLGNGDGTFQPPVTYSVPDAWAVKVGDLNGDGKQDLIVASVFNGTVTVLLGNGDGTFQNAGTYGANGDIYDLVVGDFNHDGKQDVVVANGGNGFLTVLLGDGHGGLTQAGTYSSGGAWARWLATADLNGDGNLDLVVVNRSSGDVGVLLGNGDGTFQPVVTYSVGTTPGQIALGDFNGDGKLDIAVPNVDSNNISVLMNQGNGTFAAAQNYSLGCSPGEPLVAADFNGDGKLDLMPIGSTGWTGDVLINVGQGNFQLFHSNTSPALPGVDYFLTGDFNGDGRPDLAFARNSQDPGVISVLLNRPSSNGGPSSGLVAVSINGIAAGTFNPTDLVLASGQGGNDGFTVNFGSTLTTPISVAGSNSAGDTLTVNGDNSATNVITKTPGQITWGSPVTETVYRSGIPNTVVNANGTTQNYINDPGGNTTINGGPGANTITITATTGSGVVVNGGAGPNTYIVDFGSLAGPVTIQNSNSTATNNLIVNGAAGNNTIAVAGNQVTSGTKTITNTASLANLTVSGGSGNNQLTVSALTVPVQNVTLAGAGTSTTYTVNAGTVNIVAGTGVNVLNVTGGTVASITAPAGDSQPLVFAHSYTVLDNGTLSVPANGVLASDVSPNGQAMTAVLASGPAHGTVTLNTDGSFTYTPAANFVGSDSFTYQAKGSDGTLSTAAPVTILVTYHFGGFLAPLSSNMALALNRTVPIKFQLTDYNSKFITSLSAVVSLQVLNSSGTNVLTNAGSTALRYDSTANQFIANWNTKGLPAGTYTVTLVLADGTTYTKTVTLSKTGSASGLTTTAAGGTTTAAGALLGGDIDLYVDNTNGDLTADELARIQDAVTAADAVTEPYGVAVTEVTDPTLADVTLNMDTTSAVGGYADGVLGCTTDAGQITLINGWNLYAGSDATQIGSGQYDFETVVTHELGHALGLGHSTDSTSVMYATLNTGTVNRSLTTADLNVPDTGTTGACGLHAGGIVGRISNPSYADVGRVSDPSYLAGRDMVFAMLAAGPARNTLGGLASFATRDTAFASAFAGGTVGQGVSLTAANFEIRNSDPLFAAALPPEGEDPLFDVPLFPEPSLNGQNDPGNSDGPSPHQADTVADFIAADPNWLDY